MRARRKVSIVGASVVAPNAPVVTGPANWYEAQHGEAVTVSCTVTAGQVPDRIDFVLNPGISEIVVATDSAAPFSQTWTVDSATQFGVNTLVARFVYGSGSVDSSAINVFVHKSSVVALFDPSR